MCGGVYCIHQQCSVPCAYHTHAHTYKHTHSPCSGMTFNWKWQGKKVGCFYLSHCRVTSNSMITHHANILHLQHIWFEDFFKEPLSKTIYRKNISVQTSDFHISYKDVCLLYIFFKLIFWLAWLSHDIIYNLSILLSNRKSQTFCLCINDCIKQSYNAIYAFTKLDILLEYMFCNISTTCMFIICSALIFTWQVVFFHSLLSS